MMRAGHTPEEACRIAVERVSKSPNKSIKDIQVGFLALNKHGEYGAYSLQKGFNFAVYAPKVDNELIDSKYFW